MWLVWCAYAITPLGRLDTRVLVDCGPGAAPLHYSIQYKNARGITARSEFLPFASDAEAMLHGREGSGRDAIVEVWKGDKLLVRLFGVDTRKPTTPGSA